MLQDLKELCELHGVSGDEVRIRDQIVRKVKRYAADLFEDPYGNLIVRKGDSIKPRVLLAAHMDEVGLMITGIEKEGLLRFRSIGMLPNVLMAKRVYVGDSKKLGVIGHKPIHLAKDDELKKMLKTKDLFIDIGVSSKEEALKVVQIGDYASFGTAYSEDGDIVKGKALDNRIGCFILLQMIMESDLPVHYAFTVQEEVGLRGARIVASRVKPDIAIAVDTTSSGEWPGDGDSPQYPILGRGAAITVADRSVICDEDIVRMIRKTAEEEEIPCQDKKPMIGGTDAGAMHLAGVGVRSAVISVPARYIHSPLSYASKKDISAVKDLLNCSIKSMIRKGKEWI